MNTPEIKKKIHSYIDKIEDESQLQMLSDAAEMFAAKKQVDILDLLTNEQLQRLEEANQQVDAGKVISYEEVKKISQQWLMK
ncbi:MAG: hypothetical protein ABJA32_00955 [Ginsengibacter sp.]|jgi:O6-methylguanine-DNA--protein-cysteine methyltransferase